eukprot:TRINITY_DN12192_c0_g1_i1.p2 TRINITY_DN12192_c0_g1~~TRINITY_DN12192_c0_g1_i1.p2  ORF type:complete len:51 (+),score=0.65 TRINITY_DN12192_c0_g1_i1:413-565(+)
MYEKIGLEFSLLVRPCGVFFLADFCSKGNLSWKAVVQAKLRKDGSPSLTN